MYSFLTTLSSGILLLTDQCMTGRWNWSVHSLIFLYSIRLRRGGNNIICWIPSKRRIFFYNKELCLGPLRVPILVR
jgi:hypothetical protein